MSDSSKTGRTAAELRQLTRNERAGSGAAPMGFVDEFGETQALPGDDESAYIKVPPFVSAPAYWVRDLALDANAYIPLPELDVYQRRLIQVYFTITVAPEGLQAVALSIIGEARARTPNDIGTEWYVLAVVDACATAYTAVGFGDGFLQRKFAPSELHTPVFSVPGGGRVIRTTLSFDVSSLEAFRLNVLGLFDDQQPAPLLTAQYAYSL